MKTKIVLSTLGAVLIIVLAIAYFTLPAPAPQSITQTTSSTASSTTASSTVQSYTMVQVAQHNSAQSCWTAINGNVYDVTNWIGQHPGGPEHILPLCGTDGSAAFNAQHGGQNQPAQELATFYIGALAQ